MQKSKFLYLILFLLNYLSYSQSIICEYNINLLAFEAKDNFQKNLYNKAKNESENYKILLTFFDNLASSKIKKLNQNEEDKLNIIPLMLGLHADRYFDLNNKKMYSIYNNESNILVEGKLNTWNWELKKEKKEIGNYECYKAIGKKEIIRKGKKVNSYVEAWYCPKINVMLGPDEYVGLPGLVFEVVRGKYQYVLKKITFPNKKIEINIPKNKTITEEEYLKKLKENSPF